MIRANSIESIISVTRSQADSESTYWFGPVFLIFSLIRVYFLYDQYVYEYIIADQSFMYSSVTMTACYKLESVFFDFRQI